MKYPNGSINSQKIKPNINYANRGMDLEYEINISNEYYNDQNIALIYKKPTPIKATKINYYNNKKQIADGFFEIASTTDYNGIYKGKYIDFEAKTTNNSSSFPLSNIHLHQLNHLKQVNDLGGVSFVIIAFSKIGQTFLLTTEKIFAIIKDRKSIPLSYIKEHGYLIEQKFRPRLDYLAIVDQLLEEKNEIKNKH